MDKKRIVRFKIYFDRARIYISYIQFLATLFIVVKLLRDGAVKTFIFDYWYFTFPVLFITFVFGCLIIGYIESLFKIREWEQANYSATNPEWKELIKKVNEINDKVSEKY